MLDRPSVTLTRDEKKDYSRRLLREIVPVSAKMSANRDVFEPIYTATEGKGAVFSAPPNLNRPWIKHLANGAKS